MNNHIIEQLKKVTTEPYLASLFLHTLHNLRELYCISSHHDSLKNYRQLVKAIKKCSLYNIHPFLGYLKATQNSLFLQLEKTSDGFRVNTQKDLLLYHFAQRISKDIALTKQKIKHLTKSCDWSEIYCYCQFVEIYFLPKKSHFNNVWLKNIVKKYQFGEIHIDLWNNPYTPQQIENSFHKFCAVLNITNYNLGHKELSFYVGRFYNEHNTSVYHSDGKYFMLKDFSGFTHEWAHYIDNRAFFDSLDMNLMLNNGVVSEYHSDLICYNILIKPKQLKYYSLYNLLKKLIMNEHTLKATKYYNFCKTYQTNQFPSSYWITMTEIFARLFEVYIANKIEYTILNNSPDFYDTWDAYPKIKTLEPLYKDIKQFIKLSTNN